MTDLLLVRVSAIGLAFMLLFTVLRCTPTQRAIVRSVGALVLELAEQVCDDADTASQCLRKCQDEADKRGR